MKRRPNHMLQGLRSGTLDGIDSIGILIQSHVVFLRGLSQSGNAALSGRPESGRKIHVACASTAGVAAVGLSHLCKRHRCLATVRLVGNDGQTVARARHDKLLVLE